jgi:hypothetical protein
MSAIKTICARCGGSYISGMVGMTPWPIPICPKGDGEQRCVSDWARMALEPGWTPPFLDGFAGLPYHLQPRNPLSDD